MQPVNGENFLSTETSLHGFINLWLSDPSQGANGAWNLGHLWALHGGWFWAEFAWMDLLMAWTDLDPERAAVMFSNTDANGDGIVDYEEFYLAMAKVERRQAEEQALAEAIAAAERAARDALAGEREAMRRAMTEADWDALLSLFFMVDMDANGFITEWDRMSYDLKYSSTIGKDVFGNEKHPWWGYYMNLTRRCTTFGQAYRVKAAAIAAAGPAEEVGTGANGWETLTLEHIIKANTDGLFGLEDFWWYLWKDYSCY